MMLPGHYCDDERKIMDRLKETNEFIDEVYSDGYVAGFKAAMYIALGFAALAVIFI